MHNKEEINKNYLPSIITKISAYDNYFFYFITITLND